MRTRISMKWTNSYTKTSLTYTEVAHVIAVINDIICPIRNWQLWTHSHITMAWNSFSPRNIHKEDQFLILESLCCPCQKHHECEDFQSKFQKINGHALISRYQHRCPIFITTVVKMRTFICGSCCSFMSLS